MEAAQKATGRKQELLEETRRRAEGDAKASERELQELRATAAEEKRALAVEHLKVVTRLEGSVADLEGRVRGAEQKLSESQTREEDLRHALKAAERRVAQAEQTGEGPCRSARPAYVCVCVCVCV